MGLGVKCSLEYVIPQRSVVKAIGHGGGRLGVTEDLMPIGEGKVCSAGYEAFTAATPHTMLLRIASQ
jgi:hypothetical protein